MSQARTMLANRIVHSFQKTVLVASGFEHTERTTDGDFPNHVKSIELHPREQIKRLAARRKAFQLVDESGVNGIHEGLVSFQRSHRVHACLLSAACGVCSIASFREDVSLRRVGVAQGVVVVGFRELGSDAVDCADTGRVVDAVAVGS
jgi:hypothetical protein